MKKGQLVTEDYSPTLRSMWFSVMADFFGYVSKDDCKRDVKRAILGQIPYNNPITEKLELKDYETHLMTISELSNFMDKFKVWAQSEHDANAIASHAANHPDALHFTEDITLLYKRARFSRLISHIQMLRYMHPNAKVVLWASLECTNFSKAKGGQPRDADSRTLADHLFPYIKAINPDYIQIENVEEFMCWGDMDENGKPISKDKGRSYERWKRDVMRYGYDFDYRILNAADYGAYTTRKRFFGIFAKKGMPIVFPHPTHCKGGRQDMKADREKARKELLPKCDSCHWFNFSCNIGEPGEPACPDYVERTIKEK